MADEKDDQNGGKGDDKGKGRDRDRDDRPQQPDRRHG